MANPPERATLEYEPVPQEEQAPLEFDGPEIPDSTQTPTTQEELDPTTPRETNQDQDNTEPAAREQPVPSSPAQSSRSGRRINKPNWMKDYVMG